MGQPLVSIGLPIYNGEKYLAETLDSLLDQTCRDFELIISDNASTDKTGAICEAYAARDERIRYFRYDRNRGAAWNFNNVFKLSRGKYFKWAAHDDICAPEYVASCIEVLERDPGVILCFSRTMEIDEQGRRVALRDYIQLPNLASPHAHERFRDIIENRHGCESVFGVVRSDELRNTPLIGSYMVSDRVLLALLSIDGRFHELPDYLFYQRDHGDRPLKGEDHEVTAWFDPRRGQRIVFPYWRLSWEYLCVALRRPRTIGQRLRCGWEVAKWSARHWKEYKWDLSSAVDRVILVRGDRPAYRSLNKWILSGRLKLPNPVATAIALLVMVFVEGFHWLFHANRVSRSTERRHSES